MPVPQSLLVAIGGNATHPESIRGTTEEQERVAERAAQALLPLIRSNNRILITHGNGPVVGKILLRMMLTREQIPPMRLDVCVAHSQGGIGYLLMQALENAMRRAGIERQAACVVTQVEVDAHDPAFDAPSKPIGPFFSEPEARAFEAGGWRMMDDAGGGGGIPVVRDAKGDWQGVQAVVDKDLTSALLARSLGVPDLLLLTAVDRVAIDFNTPRQRYLDQVTLAELRLHQQAGHFARGSMGPKIEAAIRHLEGGGRRAVIGHLEHALPALAGHSGTHVVHG